MTELTLLDEFAKLTSREERALGASSLAGLVGATHLCLFVRDSEVAKFLPGPGFPQTLPHGMEWMAFLRQVAQCDQAKRRLQSPFSFLPEQVSGFCVNENTILVLFGDAVHADALHLLSPGLHITSALLAEEIRAGRAEIGAALALETAVESRKLARALSNAHDELAEALDARESLLRELRRKDERLQLARSISGIGIWELNTTTREIYLAPECAAIYGFPSGEFRGNFEAVVSRIHQDDRERMRERMQSALFDEAEHTVQFRVVWPNGVMRWVENRGTVMQGAEDGCRTMIGLSMDITQRVVTEEALIRSEKLAAAGRLAASVAHEINNALEGLVNLVYLAKSEIDSDRIREFLASADDELIRVSSVARQALGFYREANTPVRANISTLVQQVLEIFRKQAQETGVLLTLELMADKAEVEGWPGEIKQAISNLLINAIHASSHGPAAIRVRVKRVGNTIQLIVADRGHGITREHLLRIFEPFFSTKKDSGTGLGLWVTRQIVEKHGGSIRVRSSTGTEQHGTVFLLVLPAAGGAAQFKDSHEDLPYRYLELNA